MPAQTRPRPPALAARPAPGPRPLRPCWRRLAEPAADGSADLKGHCHAEPLRDRCIGCMWVVRVVGSVGVSLSLSPPQLFILLLGYGGGGAPLARYFFKQADWSALCHVELMVRLPLSEHRAVEDCGRFLCRRLGHLNDRCHGNGVHFVSVDGLERSPQRLLDVQLPARRYDDMDAAQRGWWRHRHLDQDVTHKPPPPKKGEEKRQQPLPPSHL